jgi:molecular chaperone DnaJ
MSGIDYYRILGVPPSATRRAIREAYLGKVRSLHPDRVGPEGTALFQQITEAYENLSDPEKRRVYDRACRTDTKPRDPEPEGIGFGAAAEPLVGSAYRASQRPARSHSTGLDELLQFLFGYDEGPFTSRYSPEVVELQVTLTREEALRGVVLPLVVSVVEPCRRCSGRGNIVSRCRGCGGSGEVDREQMLRIRIPSGVRNGSVIEVPFSSDRGGGLPLRLYISVTGEMEIW